MGSRGSPGHARTHPQVNRLPARTGPAYGIFQTGSVVPATDPTRQRSSGTSPGPWTPRGREPAGRVVRSSTHLLSARHTSGMTAEQATVVAAFIGVVGGLAGVYIGRWQVRAEAVVEHEQWLRGQRREAYTALLAAWDASVLKLIDLPPDGEYWAHLEATYQGDPVEAMEEGSGTSPSRSRRTSNSTLSGYSCWAPTSLMPRVPPSPALRRR